MPIYVYKCGCGLRFEHLTTVDAAAPGCPSCGGGTRKIPAGSSLGGKADAGLSKEQMPQTWRGLYHGDREYVTRMQRTWEQRQKLEAKHPELAGDQRPIIAHEGHYHDVPLRAGDPVRGHGHGHGHPAAGGGSADTGADGSDAGPGGGPASGTARAGPASGDAPQVRPGAGR
ncbi:MAG TPA: zinc ribbon domain-containing protein [Pseudonocardia sp.]|nr:zinc ribbon domain-containing protein [Pseudonocardia sp.]